MNADKLVVLDPTCEPETEAAMTASRLASLDGKVVGLLDNAKPNSDRILDMVASLLGEKYRLAGIVRKRKRNASEPAKQELLEEMARECQYVITGVGD